MESGYKRQGPPPAAHFLSEPQIPKGFTASQYCTPSWGPHIQKHEHGDGGGVHNQTIVQSLQGWAGPCRPGAEDRDARKQGVSVISNPGEVTICFNRSESCRMLE